VISSIADAANLHTIENSLCIDSKQTSMGLAAQRVLAITNVFALPWDRTRGTYNQIIYKGLAERASLTLLVPVAWPDWIAHSIASASVIASKPHELTVHYLPYFYVPRLSQGFNSVLMLASVVLACPRITLFQRWDSMLGCWLFPDSIVVGWLARLRRTRFIATAIGSDVNVIAQRPLQRAQIVNSLNRSAGVVTVSDALRRELIRLGVNEKQLRVIYNGVDAEVFHAGSKLEARRRVNVPQNQQSLLFVGSMKVAKGVHELLDALAQMRAKGSKAHLYLIGTGPDQELFESHVSALGLSECVHFVGSVPHAGLGDWFRSTDLFVLPSHMEGVPNVIMEAMSCGIAVVATNVGGVAEVFEPFCGELVPAKNTQALRTAIEANLNRQFDQTRIIDHVRQFSWQSTVDQYANLLFAK
jgi:glycosyltransferase involved in cell wall biosynthesis